jgi:hypothetical protein
MERGYNGRVDRNYTPAKVAHVWTAPRGQGLVEALGTVGCGHVFGRLVRDGMPRWP